MLTKRWPEARRSALLRLLGTPANDPADVAGNLEASAGGLLGQSERRFYTQEAAGSSPAPPMVEIA